MDSADDGHIACSDNLASEPMSSTNRQPVQVDLLPFQNPLPINWPQQQWPSGEVNPAEPQIQVPMTVNKGSYAALPMNNQSFRNDRNRMSQSPMPVLLNLGQLPSSNRRLEAQPQPWLQAPVPIQIRPPSKLQKIMSVNMGVQHSPSTNKRPALPEPPQKARSESFESVRQKLRSSLVAALAVASEKQTALQNPEKSITGESSGITNQVEVNDQVASSSSTAGVVVPYMVYNEPSQNPAEAQSSISNAIIEDSTTSLNTCLVQEPRPSDICVVDEVPTGSSLVKDELLQGHGLCWVADAGMESAETATKHEVKRQKVSHDVGTSDKKHEGTSKTKEAVGPDAENLAFRIESELFKLFGGVNKKYKEKGRSLLFNLKDRNNPELRERVLSGEIIPKRLCSMTAEELASKELSQWRQAKAEEMAQMVVLPDSEIDVRRLVRKTHKGEFQLEMEQVDAVSVEVELGRIVTPQLPRRANEQSGVQSKSSNRVKDDKVSDSESLDAKFESGEQNISSNLDNLLHEKTDLMLELMEDEIKDPELLPPVISLDEFMQDLDSEPPFENLSVNPLQDIDSSGTESIDGIEPKTVILDSFEPIGAASESTGGQLNSPKDLPKSKLDSLMVGSDSKSKLDSSRDGSGSKLAQQDISQDLTANNSDKVDVKPSRSTDDSSSMHVQTGAKPSEDPSAVNILWEGLVQLNISSLATVVGKFKSGERASMKEWPSFLEVKGRVRLDAFEKFLQELPLSRSRAIMIAQFVWKEGTAESGQKNILETVDSYIEDNRVGFAEPVAGVELYLCPPHSRIRELLDRCLAKEQAETLDCISDGLIGMIVWRRPHSAISPRMPSHHNSKHSNSKRQSSSKKQQSSRSMLPSPTPPPPPLLHNSVLHSPDDDDDIDDVPPGFGPRDDDDLPEFDFVRKGSKSSKHVATRPVGRQGGGSTTHPLPPNRPVDEIRQMIHMYGQTKNSKRASIDAQPWNDDDDDDDDDDIPEWQPNHGRVLAEPQPPLPPLPPPPPQTPVPPSAYYDHHQQNQQPFPSSQPMLYQLPQQQQPHAMSISPLQLSMQPRLGMNGMPGWQPSAAPWMLPMPVDMAGIGMMQPSPFNNGQAFMSNGQNFGMPNLGGAQNGGMGWRPDISRSRGT